MRVLRPIALALALLLPLACRTRRAGHASAVPPPTDAPRAPAPLPRPPATPWCVHLLPRADLRAIDDAGDVWTLRGDSLARDDGAVSLSLSAELPCPVAGAWALEFRPDGSAFLLADGRLHLRSSRDAHFAVTPMCTDLRGAPWSRRVEGGWSFVANTWRAVGPGLLMTRDAAGASGWFATTALDRSLGAAVLDEHHSMLSLVNGGHLLLVDQVQTAAGEVLEARGELFTTLSRSPAGVAASRDVDGPRRVIVRAPSVTGPFARIDAVRDIAAPTRALVALDLARWVALTDDAIEASDDGGHSFRTVYRAPSGHLERPHAGRLRDGSAAVTTRDALVTERCPAP